MNRVVTRKRGARKGRGPGSRSKPDAVGQYASDAWSLAKRTAYGLNEIRKLINIETKVLQTSNTGAIDNAGTVSTISSIAQGLDYNNRVGDSIKLQRIEFRFRALMGTTGTKTTLRVMLVRDLDGYGTKPGVSDILESVDVLSPKKYLNADRFSVLVDETLSLSSVSNTNTADSFVLPHEGHIKYLGTTAADASNGKGTLYILWLSNESSGTNSPTVYFYTRLYFTDD